MTVTVRACNVREQNSVGTMNTGHVGTNTDINTEDSLRIEVIIVRPKVLSDSLRLKHL